ncbi:CD8A protein, partial [Mionectes macconnelli]|nr:CD8A protein [Mionectes macconnelli]
VPQFQLGQQLELECPTNRDSGAFWVRQDRNGTLHFIVFISSLSRVTFQGNQKTSTRFEASREKRFYRLVVKTFTQQDEGIYFCLMNINQMLYFSPGMPIFLAGQPHLHSASFNSAKIPSTSCLREKELNFFCDGVIWVPSAGACLLLLIALAITILQCQSKTHHNPCRCTS